MLEQNLPHHITIRPLRIYKNNRVCTTATTTCIGRRLIRIDLVAYVNAHLIARDQLLERARVQFGQIVATQVDCVHVENTTKRVLAHVAYTRVHQAQAFDVIGTQERVRVYLLDVRVR